MRWIWPMKAPRPPPTIPQRNRLGMVLTLDLPALHDIQRMIERQDAGIGAESRRHQSGSGLRETHRSLRIHLGVKASNEAGIEGIAATCRINDIDVIDRALEARAVAMRIISA